MISRFAFLSTLFTFCLTASAAPRGEDLLRASLQAEHKTSYSATETTTRSEGPTVIAHVQRKGDKRRLEYSAPVIMRGDVWVDDGTTVWRYHASERSAVRTKAAPREGATDWQRMRGRFDIQNKGATNIQGRKAWLIQFVSRQSKRVTRKLWIDDSKKIRLRTERYDAGGKRTETWALSNLKFGGVPDSAFRYSPPGGSSITNAGTLYVRLGQAKRGASWLRAPQKLPPGYAFESVVVDSAKKEAWLRYTSGTKRFSIFQQQASIAKTTPLTKAGSGWYWQTSRDRFLIAGLGEAQAKLVSDSME